MSEKLTDTFSVHHGTAAWQDRFNEKFRAILSNPENEGKIFDITVEPVKQDAAHWQHKWYRGYLLPAIARESFDGIDAQAHYELKKMFLL